VSWARAGTAGAIMRIALRPAAAPHRPNGTQA
jgi:hypothetical protein